MVSANARVTEDEDGERVTEDGQRVTKGRETREGGWGTDRCRSGQVRADCRLMRLQEACMV